MIPWHETVINQLTPGRNETLLKHLLTKLLRFLKYFYNFLLFSSCNALNYIHYTHKKAYHTEIK